MLLGLLVEREVMNTATAVLAYASYKGKTERLEKHIKL